MSFFYGDDPFANPSEDDNPPLGAAMGGRDPMDPLRDAVLRATQRPITGKFGQGPAKGDPPPFGTQWDITTLQSLPRYLDAASSYLYQQRTKLTEAESNMGTDPSKPRTGAFPSGTDLWRRHDGVYREMYGALTTAISDLQALSVAMRTIVQNYSTTERANTLSAAQVDKAFTDAGVTPAPGTPSTPGVPAGGESTPTASSGDTSTPSGGTSGRGDGGGFGAGKAGQ